MTIFLDVITINKLPYVVNIAKEIIENGGEVYRAEELIERYCKQNNKECNVFALPNLIIAECENSICIRRIKKRTEDLSKLCELNSIGRRLCHENSINYEIKHYSFIAKRISAFGACGSFCLFFGGSLIDCIISGLIALVIERILIIDMPLFSKNLISSFTIGILAYLPSYAAISTSYDKIIVGSIMMLVPGLTIANATRDMMNNDILAGLLELAYAIMSALSLAIGVAGALLITKL